MSLHRGVYRSFLEASSNAPKTKPVGYNNTEAAGMYDDRHMRVYAHDYPVMFWLERALRESHDVLDFGGHVGISFYAYERYVSFPSELSWTVLDVPAVVQRGRELAHERRRLELRFVTNLTEAHAPTILLASGSLQYVEESLSSIIARLPEKPRHILLNKTPLHAGDSFVTLQNIGTAFCPYGIFNREQFVKPLFALGYEQVDEWQNPDIACRIGVRNDMAIPAYTGMYLRLTTPRNVRQ
jgi:putative methyltransferase (TIGR04325 family)